MIKDGIWKNTGIKNLPPNRKEIGTKWVFKEKKNGIFRARLVIKDHNQIAGRDFQYIFALVTSKVALKILLIFWVIKVLLAEIVDVQPAFLYGDLEEEICIKIPSGYENV